MLCVEDIRLAAHRRLPLSASSSKKTTRMVEKRQQQWRESEANGWGKEQAGGEGGGREGPGARFHRNTLGLIYGFTQTDHLL